MRYFFICFVAFNVCSLWGCQQVEQVRQYLLEDDNSETASRLPITQLRLDVTPATGIAIVIDGQRMAEQSPFITQDLTAGPHNLEIRAMGYETVRMPIVLKKREPIHIPIALKKRAHVQPELPPAPPPPPEPTPEPTPPPTFGPLLSAGLGPIELQMSVQPIVALEIDGKTLQYNQPILILHQWGLLKFDAIVFHYRVTDTGTLELTMPQEENATWTQDGHPMTSRHVVRINSGITRFERTHHDGDVQVIIMRRLSH